MNPTALYCIENARGVHMREVKCKRKSVLIELCLAVSHHDLQKVRQIFKSTQQTYTLLNQPIFTCDAECGNCIAQNLCHFAVYNDCKDILTEFLKLGGDLSCKTFEVSVSKVKKTFVEKDSLIELIVRHFNQPVKYLQELFDESICSTDLGSSYEFKFNFSILCPNESERQMCVLNEILNSSYDVYSPECVLLQHPLIEVYLAFKWSQVRTFFYILVSLHLLFVACLSGIAVLIVDNFPEFAGLHNSSSEVGQSFEEGEIDVILQGLNWILSILGLLLCVHAVIQIKFIPFRKLSCEFEIILNLTTSICAFVMCIYGVVVPMRLQMAKHLELVYIFYSVIVLSAWTNLMLIIGRLPALGCYSLMFTTVMKNFFKVMISFVFLIIGFALSFSLVFPMLEVFNNPIGAVLKTFVMMLGEFNFSETFADKPQFLNGLSKCIFVIFIISCCIILMNLTQGIAVNDIKLLHEISQIIRLEKETRFLYEFESIFTQKFLTSHPIFRKMKQSFFDAGAIKSSETITSKDRKGVSPDLFDKLVHLYKPSSSGNNSPQHPRNNFMCFADRCIEV